MKTLVLTVPHSGTHFLLEYLVTVLGLDYRTGLEDYSPEANCDFCFSHSGAHVLSGGDQPPSEVFDCVIMTVRHPYKTIQTGKWHGNKTPSIVDSWQSLLDEQGKYKKQLFLVIDGLEEDRFPQLMAIAEHFGRAHLVKGITTFAENWQPVNQSLTDEDMNSIEFAVRAYESWV